MLDSRLQNIPISALYDGQQYLAEKYNLAIVPGLRLTDSEVLEIGRIRVLAAGVSESEKEGDLEQVKEELKAIKEALPDSKLLLNQKFTQKQFQKELDPAYFPVVHIATHGNFSSKPEETWILTWGDRYVYVNELDNLLEPANQNRSSTIKILVLSGCETAQGDRRAVLGLAGVALRSRASSTIATLWSAAPRAATVLMKAFYQQLATGEVNKAEALRLRLNIHNYTRDRTLGSPIVSDTSQNPEKFTANPRGVETLEAFDAERGSLALGAKKRRTTKKNLFSRTYPSLSPSANSRPHTQRDRER